MTGIAKTDKVITKISLCFFSALNDKNKAFKI
jgi:hypothetical protein